MKFHGGKGTKAANNNNNNKSIKIDLGEDNH